jgi:hypothetical protein
MKAEKYLSRVLALLALLASIAPGLATVGLIRLRDFARDYRLYGPLPEVQISLIDWLGLVLAGVLIAASLLLIFDGRWAVTVVLIAVSGLWVYYLPGLWEAATGSTSFSLRLGRSMIVTWQMITIQAVTMACAVAVTYLRRARSMRA